MVVRCNARQFTAPDGRPLSTTSMMALAEAKLDQFSL